ncbi:MAG: hypothetical protein ABWY25_07710, partial [Paenisporosarcina sp.]
RKCININVTILDTWSIIDKWWRPKEEWIYREYADVEWNGRNFIFVREAPDKIWRIHATSTL